MNKKVVAKKLDKLASNVAKRGIFVVNKINNVFVVQDHISKNVVVDDIPLKQVADYLCQCKNKQKEPSEIVSSFIKKLYLEQFCFKFFKSNGKIFSNSSVKLSSPYMNSWPI